MKQFLAVLMSVLVWFALTPSPALAVPPSPHGNAPSFDSGRSDDPRESQNTSVEESRVGGDSRHDTNDASSPRGRGLALVVGNSDYDSAPLRNPKNDAVDMAQKLKALGFDVLLITDGNRPELAQALREFSDALATYEVGLFYFAGHGLQVDGTNYIIPVGHQIRHEADIPLEAISLELVVERMLDAGVATKVLILDACRDNPIARGSRNDPPGLAIIDAPAGTFVGYATSPGSVAQDGAGRNGLYTGALLEALAQPGLSIERVFKIARSLVVQRASEQGISQLPWDSSSLTDDFIVNKGQNSAQGEVEADVQDLRASRLGEPKPKRPPTAEERAAAELRQARRMAEGDIASANRQKRAGRIGMFVIGLPTATIGGVFLGVGMELETSVSVLATGGLFMIVGLAIWGAGAKKKRRAKSQLASLAAQ